MGHEHCRRARVRVRVQEGEKTFETRLSVSLPLSTSRITSASRMEVNHRGKIKLPALSSSVLGPVVLSPPCTCALYTYFSLYLKMEVKNGLRSPLYPQIVSPVIVNGPVACTTRVIGAFTGVFGATFEKRDTKKNYNYFSFLSFVAPKTPTSARITCVAHAR